ncbi:uncharacterized protein CLUP02_03202 [Colletotrichum lupini]|uniref:Uncharacterized protein n=1 Tax=Colletotrichum lupini TaxID=145971 RepID=A0A9Q8SI19_9PEZI|nr:uncharacterized protein CLUP02_03202 [Colletotrichum lupini]UQC77731.1 hypothetical protein CLUP02_03202 [Colletotrichum lupini]
MRGKSNRQDRWLATSDKLCQEEQSQDGQPGGNHDTFVPYQRTQHSLIAPPKPANSSGCKLPKTKVRTIICGVEWGQHHLVLGHWTGQYLEPTTGFGPAATCRSADSLDPLFADSGTMQMAEKGRTGSLFQSKRKINPSASYPSQKTGLRRQRTCLVVRTRPVTHLDVGPRPWVADDPQFSPKDSAHWTSLDRMGEPGARGVVARGNAVPGDPGTVWDPSAALAFHHFLIQLSGRRSKPALEAVSTGAPSVLLSVLVAQTVRDDETEFPDVTAPPAFIKVEYQSRGYTLVLKRRLAGHLNCVLDQRGCPSPCQGAPLETGRLRHPPYHRTVLVPSFSQPSRTRSFFTSTVGTAMQPAID